MMGMARPSSSLTRILRELREAASVDHKGRAKLASPVGRLKVDLAKPHRPQVLDSRDAPAAGASSANAPRAPAGNRANSAQRPPFAVLPNTVSFVAGPLDEGRECVCCCQDFLDGEHLQRLPRLHTTRADCLQRWLAGPQSRGRCPECNVSVL